MSTSGGPRVRALKHLSQVAASDADAFGEGDAELAPFSTVGATLMPLLHRLRLGEGGLIGMATWAAFWESRDVLTTAWVLLLTVVLLAAVYLYNDVSDRAVDSYNPAKVAEHREPLLRRPGTFFVVALATHAMVGLAAWAVLGPSAGACSAIVLVLNPLYSRVAKRVPGVDVLVVGVMGAAVVGLATTAVSLLLIAGAMTSISHAFQTRGDTVADRAAGIHSSATAAAPAREAIWFAVCALFAWTVYQRLGAPWALSVLVPYLLLSRAPEANRAWAWARMYFAVVWIVATVR